MHLTLHNNSRKPTVMVLSDRLSEFLGHNDFLKLLGKEFNVLTIQGRDRQKNFGARLWRENGIKWELAYQVLNSKQVVRDIEAVRKVVLKDESLILLGYSSSAELVQRYISQYPNHVTKALQMDPFLFELQNAMGILINNSLLDKKGGLEELFWEVYGAKFSGRNGFSGLKETVNDDVGLQVRIFEHLYPFFEEEQPVPSPLIWLDQIACPLVRFYREKPFSVQGIYYDRLNVFQGKSIILSGVKDALIDHRVDQVLASYYPNSTFFLINDAHGLLSFQNTKLFDEFLLALLKEEIPQKQAIYQRLWEKKWIYPNWE